MSTGLYLHHVVVVSKQKCNNNWLKGRQMLSEDPNQAHTFGGTCLAHIALPAVVEESTCWPLICVLVLRLLPSSGSCLLRLRNSNAPMVGWTKCFLTQIKVIQWMSCVLSRALHCVRAVDKESTCWPLVCILVLRFESRIYEMVTT